MGACEQMLKRFSLFPTVHKPWFCDEWCRVYVLFRSLGEPARDCFRDGALACSFALRYRMADICANLHSIILR